MSKDAYFQYVRDLVVSIVPISRDVAGFISAQSCLETAFGTSAIYKDNFNLFGMKCPKKRLTTCVDQNRSHARYYNPIMSVVDFFLWCQYFGFDQSDFEFLGKFMSKLRKSPYNEKPTYVDTIFKIYTDYTITNP